MRHEPEARRVRDALTLRRAVLSLIGTGEATDEDQTTATRASADVWRIVLTRECCALPLAARLRARGLFATLPPEVQESIATAELREMQRVLAARSALDALDVIGAELQLPLTVIKGGALAAERDKPPLDLGDVDVLVTERVATVWLRLASSGWLLKSGAPMPAVPEQADANHLAAIVPPGEGLTVELHTSMEYGKRAAAEGEVTSRPLRERRSLRRLVGATGFVAALRHSVIKHAHRRGHIRDLLLLVDALRESDAPAAAIEGALGGDPMTPELLAMYHQVRALAGGERVVDDEATTRFVAWKYALSVHRSGVLGPFLPGWSGLGHLPLERPVVRRAIVADQIRYAVGPLPSDSPFATRADARANGLRRIAARTLRATYRLGLLAALLATSGYIRRRVRAMIDS